MHSLTGHACTRSQCESCVDNLMTSERQPLSRRSWSHFAWIRDSHTCWESSWTSTPCTLVRQLSRFWHSQPRQGAMLCSWPVIHRLGTIVRRRPLHAQPERQLLTHTQPVNGTEQLTQQSMTTPTKTKETLLQHSQSERARESPNPSPRRAQRFAASSRQMQDVPWVIVVGTLIPARKGSVTVAVRSRTL